MQLFGSLTNDLAVWKELAHRFHGDLRCHLIAKRWNREQTLRPQVLAAIADRGLELIIDVYFEPEEERGAEQTAAADGGRDPGSS